MKLLYAAFLVLILSTLLPLAVLADGPTPDVQPWMYPAAEYSGLGTVSAVQAAFKAYQDNQAFVHQYTTVEQWRSNYASDVTNWLHAHGCASCYITNTELSYKLKIDLPVALRDFNRFEAQGF